MKQQIFGAIIALLTIVGAVWAMGDKFIAKATFSEFKDHIIYRLDSIDKNLTRLVREKQ